MLTLYMYKRVSIITSIDCYYCHSLQWPSILTYRRLIINMYTWSDCLVGHIDLMSSFRQQKIWKPLSTIEDIDAISVPYMMSSILVLFW